MDAWWIDEPLILGSSNPTNVEVERLRREGFTVIVCLLDEREQPPGYDPGAALRLGYKRHRISVRDFHAPSVAQLTEFVNLVRSVGDEKILVHCHAGLGRTGTMAAAYWIAKGLSAAEAMEKIRRLRPGAVETPAQKAVLHQFEKSLI